LEVAELERAAEPQELVVAARCDLQARSLLHRRLRSEPRADVFGPQSKPSRIEQLEVVREQRDPIAALERVIREEHVERAAGIEWGNARHSRPAGGSAGGRRRDGT